MKCKTCNGLGRTKATEFVGVDEGLREVVILCPACGGTGKVVHPMMSMNGDEYTGEWEQHECEACNGTGVVEPLTNEEWFNGLATEEKAKRIINIAVNSDCDYRTIVEWLKQPHKENHHEYLL